jgi:hypothetical protein
MNLRQCFLILLALLCIIAPAAARETIVQNNIQQFDVGAPENHVISGVQLNNVPPNTNSTVYFDAYGESYTLWVNNTKSIGWWTFYITLQYPNGTISTTQMDTLNPLARTSEIKIQQFYGELDSIDVDVYVGLLPLTASFNNNLVDVDSELGQSLPSLWKKFSRVAFSNVAGESSDYIDLKVYVVTWDEFQRQKAESIGEYVSGTAELAVDWTWSMILAFVAAIPGVGPYMEAVLIISAAILSEIVFYVDLLFIQYPETTLLTIEFFILSSAVLKTKKKDSIITIVDRIVSAHIAVIMFLYTMASGAIDVFARIVEMVAAIIGAIKP